MKNLFLIVTVLVLFQIPINAQDEAGRGELSWQYSYLVKEFDVPVSLTFPLGPTRTYREDIPGGIGMSVSGNIGRNFALVGDFSYHRKDFTTFIAPRTDLRSRDFIFLFGPRFYLRSRYVTGFGHALFGGTYTRNEFVDRLTGGDLRRLEFSNTSFTMGFGGGADFNIDDVISIRGIQFDYLPKRLDGNWQNNFRIKSGVVFRFGEQ